MQPRYLTQVGTGSTAWQTLNWQVSPINVGIAVLVNATPVNYTVQYTLEDVSGTYPNKVNPTPTAFALSALSGATATLDSVITFPVAAIRLTNNTGTGSATMVVLQAGIAG